MTTSGPEASTLNFVTSSMTLKIRSVEWSGISRAAYETTHLASTAPPSGTSATATQAFGGRTYIAGLLSDPGELTCDVTWDAGTSTYPEISEPVEVVRLTFGGSYGASGKDWMACKGFVTGWSASTGDQFGSDGATGSVTIKFTGLGTFGTT